MSLFRSLAIAFIAAGLVACAPTINVETTQSTSARIDRYHTFTFETAPGSPIDFAPSPQSGYVKQRIEQIAEVLLQSKGYLLVTSPGARSPYARARQASATTAADARASLPATEANSATSIPSGARLRTAPSDAEDSDIDSCPELPFID